MIHLFRKKKRNPFSDHLRKEISEIKALSSQYEETRQQLLVNLNKIQEVISK